MAITLADFNKIWASTSPLTPYSFSDNNYKQGWNFIGSTPPARQMWDFIQKNNDEKMQFLANNYLPLSGGTMTGNISSGESQFIVYKTVNTGDLRIYGGGSTSDGASITVFGKNAGAAGRFLITANDGTNSSALEGRPNSYLTWGGKNIERVNSSGSNYIRYENGIQICWGRVSGEANTTSTAITFPQAFKDSNSYYGHGNILASDTTINSNTGNYSATGMTVYHTSISATITIEYVAIGFWK